MDSSSVHHHEFFTVHIAMVYGIQVCWQLAILNMLTSCQQTCMPYTTAVCTVKNSWLWTEELSETCRVLFQNKFEKLVHLVVFIIRISPSDLSGEKWWAGVKVWVQYVWGKNTRNLYIHYFLTVVFTFCTCCILRSLVCIVVSCLVCIVVVVLCVLLSSYVFLFYYVCIPVFTLDAGLLARSQFSEGPATGHLDTGFSWFPCL